MHRVSGAWKFALLSYAYRPCQHRQNAIQYLYLHLFTTKFVAILLTLTQKWHISQISNAQKVRHLEQPAPDGRRIDLVWFFLRIYVDLAVFQPYLDLGAGDNQSLKIQVARPGIEPRSSCSASQELNHSATAAPTTNWTKPPWEPVLIIRTKKIVIFKVWLSHRQVCSSNCILLRWPKCTWCKTAHLGRENVKVRGIREDISDRETT